jgi:hypothetical protein
MSEPINNLLSPDARRRLSNALMASQYDRPTPQDGPVIERAGMFPLATYANGQTGIAWPGFIAQPVESFANLLQRGYQGGTGDTQGVEDAFNVAGAAMLGGIAAPRPRGSIGMGGRPTDLPMDYESRMARARELGFHPRPHYHGTVGTFDQFDLSRGGQTSGSRAGGVGVSVSPSPDVANELASIAGGRQGGNESVMPLMIRPGRAAAIELTGNEKNLQVAATLAEAFENGYDSVVLKNYTTPNGSTGNVVVIARDPSQLRSTSAAFDPAQVGSANLLAANAGAPAAGVVNSLLAGYYGDGQASGRYPDR